MAGRSPGASPANGTPVSTASSAVVDHIENRCLESGLPGLLRLGRPGATTTWSSGAWRGMYGTPTTRGRSAERGEWPIDNARGGGDLQAGDEESDSQRQIGEGERRLGVATEAPAADLQAPEKSARQGTGVDGSQSRRHQSGARRP